MKVIFLVLFCLFNIMGLLGQDSLIFDVENYENFSVHQDTVPLKMELVNQHEEGIGEIETKWCNYHPLVITAYRLDTILPIDLQEHIVSRTKKLFVKPGMFQIHKEYETDDGIKVVIMKIENENLPMKYMMYSAYIFEDLVFDIMKMHIKNDEALEEYITSLNSFKFNQKP